MQWVYCSFQINIEGSEKADFHDWFHCFNYSLTVLGVLMERKGRATSKNGCVHRVRYISKILMLSTILTNFGPDGVIQKWLLRPHGLLTWFVKLGVAQTSGIPGTFSPPSTSKETASSRFRHASRHVRGARVVMHVGIANQRWRGKRSRHSRRMRNPQFYVSGKRPMKSRDSFDAWAGIVWHSSNNIGSICNHPLDRKLVDQ